MKKTEIIFAVLLLVGLNFKFFLLPFGGTITTISAMTLSIMYYIFGFAFFNHIKIKDIFKKEAYKDVSVLRIIGAIGAGIGISTICIGVLFKVQRWPLANDNLVVGLSLSLIVFVVAAIRFLKNKNIYYRRILVRLLIACSIGIIFFKLSNLDLIKIQFKNHPGYINAYKLYTENPTNDSLRNNLDLEFKKTYMDAETFNGYLKYLDSKKNKK